MGALPVALAFGSAVLHAAWNLRLKSSADPLRVAAVALPLGTAAATPGVGAVWLAAGRPGLPWQAGAMAALSGGLEGAYFHPPSAPSRRGDRSSLYPAAPGRAPRLATPGGLLV